MSGKRVGGGLLIGRVRKLLVDGWVNGRRGLLESQHRLALSSLGVVAVLAAVVALLIVRMEYTRAYGLAQQANSRLQVAQQALAQRQADVQVARQREDLLRFARQAGLWQGDWVPVQLSLQNAILTSAEFGVAIADMMGGPRKIPDLSSFDISVREPGFDLFSTVRPDGGKQVLASVTGRVWVGREDLEGDSSGGVP